MSRGFVVIEIAIACVLLSLAIAALVPVFVLTIRSGENTHKLEASTYLSQELLEEIRLRKWDKNSGANPGYILTPSTFGVTSATDKTTITDVSGFNGWTESGARDPLNNPISAFSNYTRTVSVTYVSTATLAALPSLTTTSDFKQVTVCTFAVKSSSICLTTIIANR